MPDQWKIHSENGGNCCLSVGFESVTLQRKLEALAVSCRKCGKHYSVVKLKLLTT